MTLIKIYHNGIQRAAIITQPSAILDCIGWEHDEEQEVRSMIELRNALLAVQAGIDKED